MRPAPRTSYLLSLLAYHQPFNSASLFLSYCISRLFLAIIKPPALFYLTPFLPNPSVLGRPGPISLLSPAGGAAPCGGHPPPRRRRGLSFAFRLRLSRLPAFTPFRSFTPFPLFHTFPALSRHSRLPLHSRPSPPFPLFPSTPAPPASPLFRRFLYKFHIEVAGCSQT
jgi:hypothetical protein